MLTIVQIGGSLAKLVYFSYDQGEDGRDLGGRLNFLKFPTDKIDACIEFMKRLKAEHEKREAKSSSQGGKKIALPDLCVMATGGGAYKFYDRIKEALGVAVQRGDEMECLIIGTIGTFFQGATSY